MTTKPYSGPSGALKADSEWLASEDLPPGRDVPVVIKTALLLSDVPLDQGRKYSGGGLEFDGAAKKMILNSTNRKTLVRLFGPDTTAWIGKGVDLYVDPKVRFGGKIVSGVRIRDKESDAHAAKAAAMAGAGDGGRCGKLCGDTADDEPQDCGLDAGHAGECKP